MIDNFLGIDTEGGHWTLWFLPYNAACSDDFLIFYYKGQVKFPILHNTKDGSKFTFRTICNFRGRALGYLSIMKPA